jgi:hypothetical protein
MPEVFNHRYEIYFSSPAKLVEVHEKAIGIEAQLPELICKPLTRVTYSDFDFDNSGTYTDDNSLYENQSATGREGTSRITGGYLDYLTIPANTKRITNPIQLEATVSVKSGKSQGKTPDANIKLYNLSDDTLDAIEAGVSVVLKAGYETDSEIPIIFVGQVEAVQTTTENQDRVTKITAKEATNTIKTTMFGRSYPIGYDYQYIILDLINEFGKNGVPMGHFLGNARSASPLQEGSTYSGKLSECLSEVCEEIDFVWYTCKGKLYVQPADEPVLTETLTIEPQNVVGSIKPSNDKSGASAVDRKAENMGITFDTFLNGDTTANSRIRVNYGRFYGDYLPDEITHKLNWKRGPWTTTVKCQKQRNN